MRSWQARKEKRVGVLIEQVARGGATFQRRGPVRQIDPSIVFPRPKIGQDPETVYDQTEAFLKRSASPQTEDQTTDLTTGACSQFTRRYANNNSVHKPDC